MVDEFFEACCSNFEDVFPTWWTFLMQKGWCFNAAVWSIDILSPMFECSCSVQTVNHTQKLTHTHALTLVPDVLN